MASNKPSSSGGGGSSSGMTSVHIRDADTGELVRTVEIADQEIIIGGLLAEARRCVTAHQPTQALDLVLRAVRMQRGEQGVFQVLDETRQRFQQEQAAASEQAQRAQAGGAAPKRASQQMGSSAAAFFETAFGSQSVPPSVLAAALQGLPAAAASSSSGAAASPAPPGGLTAAMRDLSMNNRGGAAAAAAPVAARPAAAAKAASDMSIHDEKNFDRPFGGFSQRTAYAELQHLEPVAARAPSQQQQQSSTPGGAAQQAAPMDASEPILVSRGKEQILEDAVMDGSSAICPMCNAVIARTRFDAHVTMWCDKLED